MSPRDQIKTALEFLAERARYLQMHKTGKAIEDAGEVFSKEFADLEADEEKGEDSNLPPK